MHRDLSSYACHTSKHLCTERTTSDSLMVCHQRLSIANIDVSMSPATAFFMIFYSRLCTYLVTLFILPEF